MGIVQDKPGSTNTITLKGMMMHTHKTLVASLLVIGMGAMSLPSHAQDAPREERRPRPVLTAESIAQIQQDQVRRHAQLHDKLDITAAQEDAWKAYVKAAEIRLPQGGGMPRADAAERMTTPERLERELARVNEHRDRLVERVAATKALYAVLTPQQQQLFDAHPAHGPKPHGKKPRHGHGPKDGPDRG